MEFKDYYQIMSLDKTASQKDIKKAYRKLARKYHPDVSKASDAEQKFKELGEAYEVLKDPEKRASYDQLGKNWKSGQDFNPPPGWDAGYEYSGAGGYNTSAQGGDNSADFSDFFESLFGQSGARYHYSPGAGLGQADAEHQLKGADHHAKVLIDLEDSFAGSVQQITLQSPKINQQGQVVTEKRTLKIKIPKGVRQGQQIRLVGQGESGVGQGNNGDLYIELEFKPHPFYSAEGHDLFLKLPIAPWEAALGSKVKIPTPSGIIDLKIPADSVSGRKLRLKGRGIPSKSPGDLYAVLQIVLPPANSQKAQDFYRKMEQELKFNPRTNLGV